jgi:putative ABC transport system permease protein
MARVAQLISDPNVLIFYDLQVMSGKVTSAVSGGCLLLTSVVTLFFYIKHYIDAHKPELGVLKALGYSNIKIARGFWVFGLSALAGSGIGFCGAFAFMPAFYETMNDKGILPDISVHFNGELVFYLIVLPTLFFSLLSVAYGLFKLKSPVMELIKGNGVKVRNKKGRSRGRRSEKGFLRELRRSTVSSRFSLVFFIAFSSFCYSSMTQMSFSMDKLSSRMMGVMMMGIGLVLAFTALLLALTTVMKLNAKTIAMLRVFGYSDRECGNTVLNGYRPAAYLGFAIGTAYQYGLLKLMVSFFFAQSVVEIPEYRFDIKALVIALVTFAFAYEIIVLIYSTKIKRLPLKRIMMEE